MSVGPGVTMTGGPLEEGETEEEVVVEEEGFEEAGKVWEEAELPGRGGEGEGDVDVVIAAARGVREALDGALASCAVLLSCRMGCITERDG